MVEHKITTSHKPAEDSHCPMLPFCKGAGELFEITAHPEKAGHLTSRLGFSLHSNHWLPSWVYRKEC